MSYDLFSGMDYVGPVASSRGWSDVLAATEKAEGKNAAELLTYGISDHPGEAADELEAWLARANPPSDVRETVANLIVLLRKAKAPAIISDGVGFDIDGRPPRGGVD